MAERWARFQEWTSHVPLSVLGCLCFAWIAITCGLAPTPNIDAWVAAARTFPEPSLRGTSSFVHSSPVGIAIAHLLRVDDERAYVAVHLVLLVVVLTVAVATIARRFGPTAGRLAIAALFASPISNVLLTWLGQPDPLTLGFGIVAGVATRPMVLASAAAAATVTHREQALVMLGCVVVVRIALSDVRLRQALAIGSGVALGAAAFAVFEARYGIGISRADFASTIGLDSFLRAFVRAWPAMLAFCFGAAWVAVVGLGRHLMTHQRVAISAALIALFVVSVFTQDTTRVFAVTTMPSVIALIGFGVTHLPSALVHRLLAATVAAGVAIPHFYVFNGDIYSSSVLRSWRWFLG